MPHFQYVCGWYQEGDQPFSQEFNHSCLKLWEDFLDRLERCFDVWDVCCRGYSYRSSGIFVSKVESAQFGDPLAWFLHIYSDLGQWPCQVAWISSVIARKSVPEILLGALLLVGDIAWLTLLCLCSVVCGCGPLYALHVWWNHVG